MSRPQIIVNVDAALQRRGTPTDTGTTFLVYAGASGPSVPTVCLSAQDALNASVPQAQADWVGDALSQGAPKVVVLRAAAVSPASVTEAEWTTALAKLSADYGPGQVVIPGVSGTPVYNALLAHAAAFRRCVLLDGAVNATASALTTAAAALSGANGSEFATIIGSWVNMPATGGGTRQTPGSVLAAGIAARGDAANGHANQAPIFDQGRGAGVVARGVSTTATFTNAELDSLHDAGVSVIRTIRGVPTLAGWASITAEDAFRQLNWGRFTMQLAYGIGSLMEAYLGRQIDGRGLLFAEASAALSGYLLPFYAANALFGETSADAFDVDVAGVTTQADIVAGVLNAAVEVSLSPHTERVTISVVTNVAQGVAA
ncbi:hypothetical protein K8Z61_18535 [Nocardioides sp. TRM66260-LWL]|uniref:hypothetical protein n=1 Tax=Nocardioides sp. TRM66260-LWL TaxID=2874478 RepID=UPI001CC54593|nr:hypothetical protein [Nocardioides sp. TRM66260-LWL]MBZ5736493.1 hypothetical protein [Nocardioides sp. TRM66260-LWL]